MQNSALFITIHSESFTFADKSHTEPASYRLSNYETIVFIDNRIWTIFFTEIRRFMKKIKSRQGQKYILLICLREKESRKVGVYIGTPLMICDFADSSH